MRARTVSADIQVRVQAERAAGRTFQAIADGLERDHPERHWWPGQVRRIALDGSHTDDRFVEDVVADDGSPPVQLCRSTIEHARAELAMVEVMHARGLRSRG